LQSDEKANNVLLNHYRPGRVDGTVGIVTRLGGSGFVALKLRDRVWSHTGFYSLRAWGSVAEDKATGS